MLDSHRVTRLLLLDNEVPHAIRAGDRAVFTGDASVDYVCGSCGAPLCVGMRDGDLVGIVFICKCGACNRVPALATEWEGRLRESQAAARARSTHPHRRAAAGDHRRR